MKAELQQNLLKKYPEFFQDELPIYTGDSTKEVLEATVKLLKQEEMVIPIQFGFECGNGWYVLLDTLMEEIQQHIKWKNESLDREFKYKWMWDLQRWFRLHARAVKNWKTKIADWIYENAPKGKPHISIRVDQVKEKFGGLRFYYHGGDKEIDGMVRLAEGLSYRTCEFCGSTKDIGYTQGWIISCCKSCHETDEQLKRYKWEPRKTDPVITLKATKI